MIKAGAPIFGNPHMFTIKYYSCFCGCSCWRGKTERTSFFFFPVHVNLHTARPLRCRLLRWKWGGVGCGGAITFRVTCTRNWCYARDVLRYGRFPAWQLVISDGTSAKSWEKGWCGFSVWNLGFGTLKPKMGSHLLVESWEQIVYDKCIGKRNEIGIKRLKLTFHQHPSRMFIKTIIYNICVFSFWTHFFPVLSRVILPQSGIAPQFPSFGLRMSSRFKIHPQWKLDPRFTTDRIPKISWFIYHDVSSSHSETNLVWWMK